MHGKTPRGILPVNSKPVIITSLHSQQLGQNVMSCDISHIYRADYSISGLFIDLLVVKYKPDHPFFSNLCTLLVLTSTLVIQNS